MPYRWTDEFLNEMASHSDAHADDTLVEFEKRWPAAEAGDPNHGAKQSAINALFRQLDSNSAVPPEKIFPVMHDFFVSSREDMPGFDLSRVQRAQDLFCSHLFEGALALLHKSLPEGYAAPNLSEILTISDDLKVHPFKRLLGTLQLVLDVSACHSFEPNGAAAIVAQKLRLLHSGVRHLVPKYRPEFTAKFGIPVNLEDMLATNIGFSLLVLQALRGMNVGWTPEQEEDYFYLWRAFSMMMGIHPPYQGTNWAYIPDDVADGEEFYKQYCRRHYVPADRNPNGVQLAQANIQMLKKVMPWWMKAFGMGILPRLYMRELIGDEICDMLLIQDVWGRKLIRKFTLEVIKFVSVLERRHEPEIAHLSITIFQGMINHVYGEPVTFTIPDSIDDMRGMVGGPPARK